MLLYHGSYTEVKNPVLSKSRRMLDFGSGFYTTSDRKQAEKWAHRVVEIRGYGSPFLSIFETVDMLLHDLSVLHFDNADSNWLHTVVKFRTDQMYTVDYDIISGPVADDRTIDVINMYVAGAFSEDIALQLLLPMHFTDQWTFKTEKSLQALRFKECIAV